MEATCSSQMSIEFQRTTQRYVPETSTLQGLCAVKLCNGTVSEIDTCIHLTTLFRQKIIRGRVSK
jgi:hypothetical protein